MMGSWIGMVQDGVPLTLLGETDWSHGGDKILAKKGFKIETLKGQTVGVYLNKPSVTYFLDQFLKKGNLKLSDVKVVELEPETITNNFISSKFNVIVNYDPQALRAEREGNGVVVATSATFPGCIPEGFVSRSEVVKEIPENDLVTFFAGWIEAVKWINNKTHWEEYKKILNEKTFEGEKPYSEKDLKDMLDSVSIHDPKMQFERNQAGGGLAKYVKNINLFLKENGNLKKDFSAESLVDTKALVEALSKESKK